MWKKPETDGIVEAESPDRTEKPATVQRTLSARKEAATIGPSISIRGDLTGEEDLVVEGRVEGTIDLKQNNLTVGKDGRVNASVRANTISVDGEVEGDLSGDEQVVIRRSGNVHGNIIAPRVTLEDGCKFKGSIDMDVPSKGARAATGPKPVADVKPMVSPTADKPRKSINGVAAEEKMSSP
jgi:cytoskeletal protein CcmA (bactofilin family)